MRYDFLLLIRQMFANSPDRQLRLDFGAPVPFRFGKLLICLILSVFLTHCGAARVQVYQYPQPDNFPRTVAILPFTFEKDISEPESPHVILRQTFFNYFSYLGYTDMPLEEVNTRLRKAGYKFHEATTMNVKELRDALGVDAVIRGHVLEANNFTGGFYAETRIRAHIRMVDLKRNQVIWETDHQELDNTSILALTVVDTIQTQIGNADAAEAYSKVAEAFTLKIMDEIPDPAELRRADVRLPKIQNIEANVGDAHRKLKPNDVVRVTMTGEPGLVATFDIGGWKKAVPMTEKKPGYYEGAYQVTPQDKIEETLIVASLKDRSGVIGKKVFRVSGRESAKVENHEKSTF